MKVEELRIGNLIYSTALDINISIYGICYDEEYNKYSIEVQDEFNDLVTAFEPIPLTEEWLLKFGFIIHNRSWLELTEDMRLEYLENEGLKICIETTYSLLYDNLKHIKYVHQLQNLYFALTNKELKIKELCS